MGQNLGPLNISSSYQALVQISGSQITDGTGSLISSLDITATSASYALNAGSALSATTAVSASFATTASYALNAASTVDTGSLLTTASISDAQITFTKGDASTFNITVNNVVNADSASVATTATSASHAVNADSAISASFATTASFALNAGDPFPYTGNVGITGDINLTGSYNRLSGSFSGSVIDNITDTYTATAAIEHVITLTQAQYNAISASADPNTLYYITDAASFVTSASYAATATSASFATTASYALNADVDPFPYTGSAEITGSLGVTGSAVISDNVSVGANTNTGTNSLAVGLSNETENYNLAVGANNTLDSNYQVALGNGNTGGNGGQGGVLMGYQNTSADSTDYNLAVGYRNHVGHSYSAVIGGANMSSSAANQVTVPDLVVSGSLTAVGGVTGSLLGTASYANISDDLVSGANINISSITASGATFTNLTATSASIGHLTTVTGSAVIIGDAYVIVNSSGATRYAGLAVYESGSVPATTASFNFDSLTNDWFYEYTGSDPTNFGVAMFGPEYSVKGTPSYPTNNRLVKGNGGHHLNDSSITDDGSTVSMTAELDVTGGVSASAGFLGNLTGNADTATSASHAVASDTAISASHAVSADSAVTASYVLNAVSASYSDTSVSASHALVADTATTASYVLNAVSASYILGSNVDGAVASATSASHALVADTATTASYVASTVSASYAATATSASFASTVADGITLNDPVVNGQMYGNVSALSIASLTASLDCTAANFFTLTLVDGSDTHITATNPTGGQTVNIQITNGASGTGTVSFDTSKFKFPGGTATTGSAGASAIDVVSFVCFDDATLLANYIENLS